MAKIPESLTEKIDGLKKAFTDTKAGIDEGLAGIKPKKPLFSLSIGNKFLLVLAEVMLISAAIGIIVFVNIPMFLVNEVYLQHIYGDYRAPGWYYQDAYTKIKAGKRKEVKVQIKNANTFLASFKEEETVLGPLVGEDIYITKIQYGNCATNWWISVIAAMTFTGLHISPLMAASGLLTMTGLSFLRMPRRC